MSKLSSLVKLSIAFVFCMVIVNCGQKTKKQSAGAAQSVEAADTIGTDSTDVMDDEDFVVSGDPGQMLEISNAWLEYLQSAHIENADDANDFENAMADVKEMLSAVSDTINARLEVMTPEEKGDMVAKVTDVSEKMEENNPSIMKEIQRLEKEAKKIGITLPVDL